MMTSRFDSEEAVDEVQKERSLLDRLLTSSKLYTQSQDFKDLMDFVVRLRNFSPFNAMLLQIQKPGLQHAASERDWWERFRRRPKEGARPLLILWPFGPVSLVYDVLDTEGKEHPKDVKCFVASGPIREEAFLAFRYALQRKGITWVDVDAGDGRAGSIRVTQAPAKDEDGSTLYQINVNKNHPAPTRFATVAHELAHLTLGHLGKNWRLKVPDRRGLNLANREVEAECTAYLVCARNGVSMDAAPYLSDYVGRAATVDNLDLYQIMRAAGAVESLLALKSGEDL